MTALGDRMKANYEDRARHMLTRRVPVIVRVDGRAFHSLTRGMDRPFDQRIVDAMVGAARIVAGDAQGCKAAYIQSDEASFLLTDFDRLTTEAWFDYSKSKVESIAASLMSVAFTELLGLPGKTGIFDARAFNVPAAEVSNYFLWRALDWRRNSVAMYCGAFHSHREMHGKGHADQHEMLHAKGKNWATDLPAQLRNGTFLTRTPQSEDGGERAERFMAHHDVLPRFAEIEALIAPLMAPEEEG
jgi:tRNA(His) 5'-end guanylyltransferase